MPAAGLLPTSGLRRLAWPRHLLGLLPTVGVTERPSSRRALLLPTRLSLASQPSAKLGRPRPACLSCARSEAGATVQLAFGAGQPGPQELWSLLCPPTAGVWWTHCGNGPAGSLPRREPWPDALAAPSTCRILTKMAPAQAGPTGQGGGIAMVSHSLSAFKMPRESTMTGLGVPMSMLCRGRTGCDHLCPSGRVAASCRGPAGGTHPLSGRSPAAQLAQWERDRPKQELAAELRTREGPSLLEQAGPQMQAGGQRPALSGSPPSRPPAWAQFSRACLGSICSLLMETGVWEWRCFQVGSPLINLSLCRSLSPQAQVVRLIPGAL